MAEFNWQTSLAAVDKDEGEDGAVVPKEALGLYAKDAEGKFQLQDGLRKRLDVSGLKGALEKERKQSKEVNALLAKYKEHGATPDELAAKMEDLQKRAEGKGDEEGAKRWEKARLELTAAHAKVISEKDAEVTKYKSGMGNYIIDAEATKAIAEMNGSVALLLPHIRSQVKVVEEKNGDTVKFILKVVDSAGDPRVTTGGDMTVADLVQEMSKSTDFSMAFKPKGTSGTGAPSQNKGGKPADEVKSAVDKIAAGLAARRNQR